MARPGSRLGLFFLEGVNSFGAALYFNYLFFLLRQEFHLSAAASLGIAALHGGVYMMMSRTAGAVVRRWGYVGTFRIGCAAVTVALVAGGLVQGNLAAQVGVFVAWTLGICLTWPPLQAMATEGEGREETARAVGIYNLVWSGMAGISNFVGGGIYDRFGEGSIFWGPALLSLLLVVLAPRLAPGLSPGPGGGDPAVAVPPPCRENQRFLRLARVANPFAYVAINCLIPTIPLIASRLHLSPTESGWVNSTWFLGRSGMFLLLWRWMAWHYRMDWLLGSFLGMIIGFLAVVLAGQLWVLVGGQLLFGLGLGLIYYSSLFYAMDAGGEKGEHGGLHESAIGAGTCVGPALSGTAMVLLPSAGNAVAWVGGGLLAAGFVLLVGMSRRRPAV